MNFQVYSKKANLLTKLRFTLKTVKYYFEVLWHLKVKKLWFLNICSKIFRNGYERVLFFVHDIRKKMTTEKEWVNFFDSCWGSHGYLGLQTNEYSSKPSFTPYSYSMKVGSPSSSPQLVAKSKSVVNELGSPSWSRKTFSVSDNRHQKDDLFGESQSFRVLSIGPKIQNFHNGPRKIGPEISLESFREIHQMPDFQIANH